MTRSAGIFFTLSLALALGAAAAAGALAAHIPSSSVLKFSMSVSPRELPKHESAPVALSIRARIGTSDGSVPAESRELDIEFDRSLDLSARGLAVCTQGQLEGSGMAARESCRGAIVGTGSAEAVSGAGTQATPIALTAFNGGVHGNATTILIRTSVTAVTPRPVVVAAEIKSKSGGWSGSLLTAEIPPLDDSFAALIGFDLEIKRLFRYEGAPASFLSASCPSGSLRGQLELTLADGSRTESTAIAPCR